MYPAFLFTNCDVTVKTNAVYTVHVANAMHCVARYLSFELIGRSHAR